MKKEVVIVGSGPSGLATAACLNLLSIPNVVLERDHCSASLWKNRSYDRLKLHIAKQFCSLPHMPHSVEAPTFIPRVEFVNYLDDYAARFSINSVFNREVVSAVFDEEGRVWRTRSRDTSTGEVVDYVSRFLVVATGDNSEGVVPDVPGQGSFPGEAYHSAMYKSGKPFAGKRVLVVGSGNSGMEIVYDLSNFGAKAAISTRSPFHVLTKEMVHLGMVLFKYLPLSFVDNCLLFLSRIKYGDLSKYGINRPSKGPFSLKFATGGSLVIDVGAVDKIKSGEIQVFKGLSSIADNEVVFTDGRSHHFDAIVFATGYKSTANSWLEDYDSMLNKNGLPKNKFPNHWKGEDGLYCAGLSKRGLLGISMDAQSIADDIKSIIYGRN